jgi:hypothetical protein
MVARLSQRRVCSVLRDVAFTHSDALYRQRAQRADLSLCIAAKLFITFLFAVR